MSNLNETYLGDGLYASDDGYQITLRAPRVGGDQFVCVEDSILEALLEYLIEKRPEAVAWLFARYFRKIKG